LPGVSLVRGASQSKSLVAPRQRVPPALGEPWP